MTLNTGAVNTGTLDTVKLPGDPYAGAAIFSARSADGALFFIYSGKRPNGPFQQQVARFKDNKWTWYDVPVPSTPRPSMSIEHDGLYITYLNDDDTTLRRWKVPDYVVPDNGGSGGSSGGGGSVDTVARTGVQQNRALIDTLTAENQKLTATVQKLTSDLQKTAQQVQQLQKDVTALKQRPVGNLTWLQIKDHLWNDSIIQDKVYLDLQQKGGIYGMIEVLVKSIVGK